MTDDQDPSRPQDPPPVPTAPWAVPGAVPGAAPEASTPPADAPTDPAADAAAEPPAAPAAATPAAPVAVPPGAVPPAAAAGPEAVASGTPGYPTPPTAPPAPPVAPRRGLSTGAVLGIVGGAVGLLLVIAIVVVVVVVNIATSRAQAAPDAVRGYLEAIAAGDAAKAKTYLSAEDRSGPLLTSAVLKESRAAAPIRGITIGSASSSYDTVVHAAYRVGTRKIATTFTVVKSSQTYEIADGLTTLSLYSLKGLDVTVNGQTLRSAPESVKVFPGTYTVGLESKYLEVSGGARVTLADPKDYGASTDLTPSVTAAGKMEFRSLVTASVTACLAQTTLDAGCGLAISSPLSDGTTIDEGSVQRSITPEIQAALPALDPETSSGTPWLVSAHLFLSPDVTVIGTTTDGQHGRFDLVFGPSLDTAYVDFSQSTPAVTWK